MPKFEVDTLSNTGCFADSNQNKITTVLTFTRRHANECQRMSIPANSSSLINGLNSDPNKVIMIRKLQRDCINAINNSELLGKDKDRLIAAFSSNPSQVIFTSDRIIEMLFNWLVTSLGVYKSMTPEQRNNPNYVVATLFAVEIFILIFYAGYLGAIHTYRNCHSKPSIANNANVFMEMINNVLAAINKISSTNIARTSKVHGTNQDIEAAVSETIIARDDRSEAFRPAMP